MIKQRRLTRDNFNQLLAWLDDDREQAGQKYEDIRHSLIKILVWNGCHEAEDLADEAINRVIEKVPQLADEYEGDPKVYFYGVVKNLLREWRRQQAIEKPASSEFVAPVEFTDQAEDPERLFACLEHCLRQLGDSDRQLILQYYQENKQAKIDSRKQIASDLNIGLNALRVKVHRIRAALHKCIERRLSQRGTGEID